MPLLEVVAVATVTHLTQVHLGPTQDQTPLVAGTAEASMAEAHPMIGNVRM